MGTNFGRVTVNPPQLNVCGYSVSGDIGDADLGAIINSGLSSALGATASQANPQAQIMEGIKGIDKLLGGNLADGWEGAQAALSVFKSIPDPISQAIGHIGSFATDALYQLFGDKPCKFTEKGECSWRLGSNQVVVLSEGECCSPKITGRGVVLAEHEPGYKKFPGRAAEVPAWDYYHSECDSAMKLTPEKEKIKDQDLPEITYVPCADLPGGYISGVMVLPNWKIKLYESPAGFSSNSIELGPGLHALASGPIKYNDRNVSMKIRGPWTYQDALIAKALKDKKKGWITSYMSGTPTDEQLVQLVTLDPLRPKPPQDFNAKMKTYLSIWRPGWFFRLSTAGVLELPAIKSIFETLGIDAEVLSKAKVDTLKDVEKTAGFIAQAAKNPDAKAAGDVLAELFKVSPALGEISANFVKNGLKQGEITQLQNELKAQIEKAEKEVASVSGRNQIAWISYQKYVNNQIKHGRKFVSYPQYMNPRYNFCNQIRQRC